MANIRRAYGEWSADIRRKYGKHTANMRQKLPRTYGEHTLKTSAAKRLTFNLIFIIIAIKT